MFEHEMLYSCKDSISVYFEFRGRRYYCSIIDVLNQLGLDGWKLACNCQADYILVREIKQEVE